MLLLFVQVVWEDDFLAVIIKPPGVAVRSREEREREKESERGGTASIEGVFFLRGPGSSFFRYILYFVYVHARHVCEVAPVFTYLVRNIPWLGLVRSRKHAQQHFPRCTEAPGRTTPGLVDGAACGKPCRTCSSPPRVRTGRCTGRCIATGSTNPRGDC